MNNLTDCKTYKELVLLVSERGWNSTQVASKCWHYHQNIALSKTDKTLRKRQEVYEWLCQYQEEYHTGNNPSKYKEEVLGILGIGMSVAQVYDKMLSEGKVVAKSTIYKYKKEISIGEQ